MRGAVVHDRGTAASTRAWECSARGEGDSVGICPLHRHRGCGCTRASQSLHHPIWAGRSLAGTQPPSGWIFGEGTEKTLSFLYGEEGPPAIPCALGTRTPKSTEGRSGSTGGDTASCPRGARGEPPAGASARSRAAISGEEPCSPAAARGELAVISHDHPLMTST